MNFEQKYLKYKAKYLELKKMLGGYPFSFLFYRRVGISPLGEKLRLNQVIEFHGELYSAPIMPDLPNHRNRIGSCSITYLIKNILFEDVLVDITFNGLINGFAYRFFRKDVAIEHFYVLPNGELSPYRLNTYLNHITNTAAENPFLLAYEIDSYQRFAMQTGNFYPVQNSSLDNFSNA
jgi:hypothetical protein